MTRGSLLLSQLGRVAPAQAGLASSRPGPPEQPRALAASFEERRQQQWELAAQPTLKLQVRERGWYRVEQAELLAAGLGAGVNPRFLKLFVEGEELPLVVQGESDQSFDPGDAIQFYATGADTTWTDTRTYWLVEGGEPGRRVPLVMTPSGGQEEPESFPFTLEQKERTIYVASVKNGETENFFGPVVNQTPVQQLLTVHHLDGTQEEAQLEVSLQGLTEVAHRVKVQFNEMEVGSISSFGSQHTTTSFTLPISWLVEGENVVTMVAEGSEIDVSLVDAIRLTYGHTYTADGDVLEFTVSGPAEGEPGQPVTLEGFSSAQIAVADVTDPMETKELEGVVQPQGEGFSITVWVPDSGLRTLLAVTGEQLKQPAAIQANGPSDWHSADAGAEVVIFSHRNLLESVEPLKALREAQGYSVAVVDVEDVYDEFAFGAKTPRALQDFLRWGSEQWQTKPRFVLLFGDASFDPRDYLGMGDLDLVPTWMLQTAILETASDDFFVDFDSDGVPDLAVGRLPVRTPEEAATVVGKIVAYDSEPDGPWKRQVLLVADQDGPGFEFEQMSTGLKASLGAQLTLEELLRGPSGAEAKTQLLAKLNQGRLLVNYMGHGSVELWRGLLTSEDARALTNGSRLPFFVSLTCLNGFFHDLFSESLAEALLRAEQGGAIAVWASSALTSPKAQLQLEQELFRLLSEQEGLTLGEAVARAKASISDPDVRGSWIFFGDPLTQIRELSLGPAERVSLQALTNQGTIELLSEPGVTFDRAVAVENPAPQGAPPAANFPVDFIDFTVRGYTQATTVTLFLDDGVRVNTYWKFGPTPALPFPHWYEFLYDGRVGAEILSDRIILHFVDGERGDDDLTVNGEISSRGGPAFSAPPVVPSLAQISSALNPGGTGEEMFVGIAVVNPNDYPNAIYLSAMDSSGTEIDRVILAEIPAQGQDAFLIDEVMSPLLGEMAVIARGQEGPIQSFFLIGDYALRRLDGVAGEFQASTSLYFPVIPQGNNGSTMLFVFNPTIETASALFRQLDPDGVLVEEVSRTIAAGGFLAQTLEDLFDDSGGGEIYIQVEADVPLMGFEFSPGAEDFSALAAQVPQSATRLLLPHFFVDDRGSQTEIRLLQTDDTPVAVTVRAFDDDSLLLGQTQFELAPDTLFVGELAELLNLDLVGHEFGITGYLEVEFEEMASVVGAVTFTSSAGGGRATRAMLPLIHGGRTRTSFLQVGQSQELGMFTGLAILNAGSETATVTVQAFDLDGYLSGEVEFALEAGVRRVGLLNEAMFFGAGFDQVKGHFQVISSEPVVNFALFGDFALEYLSAIEGQQGLQ